MRRLLLLLAGVTALPAELAAGEAGSYLQDVKPMLKERCFACHGGLKQQARLRLDAAALIRKGGRHGPAIKPGDPDGSLLIERVSDGESASRMPPQGKPLSERQIALLKAWIKAGAPAPAGEMPEEDPRSHWAFQKLVRPSPPAAPGNAARRAARAARPGPRAERADCPAVSRG